MGKLSSGVNLLPYGSESYRPARKFCDVVSRGPIDVRDRNILWCLAALYPLTFTSLSIVLARAHGFPLDDSYIHQTVARNFAGSGTLGFIVGQHSSGATSLLWTLIQALNFSFYHALDPVWYNLAISYLLFIAVGPLLFTLFRRDGLPYHVCILLAVAPAFSGNFLWLGIIGMEHLLFVVLSLSGICFWFGEPASPRFGPWYAGIVAALLVITRPEASLYGPLLVLLGFWAGIRRSATDYAKVMGMWMASLTLSVSINWWTSRSLLPATIKGRTWLYFHGSGGVHSERSKLRFIGSWIERLPRLFSTAFTSQPKSLHDLVSPGALLGLGLFAIILVGTIVLIRQRPLGTSALLCWATIHFMSYFAVFPAAGHGGRYQPLCLLLAFPLLLIGLDASLALALPRAGQTRRVIQLVVLLVGGVSSLYTWRQVSFLGISHINNTHGKAAIWINQHLPTDAHLAAFDIGRISYDWRGQVTDLGGLVDPMYFPYLQQRRVPEYLRQRQVRYVLLPSSGMEDLGLYPSMLSSPLVQYCDSTSQWLLAFRYTIHATQCQVLYEVK